MFLRSFAAVCSVCSGCFSCPHLPLTIVVVFGCVVVVVAAAAVVVHQRNDVTLHVFCACVIVWLIYICLWQLVFECVFFKFRVIASRGWVPKGKVFVPLSSPSVLFYGRGLLPFYHSVVLVSDFPLLFVLFNCISSVFLVLVSVLAKP